MGKRVLVVGSGGREHALAWKIAQSPGVGKVYAAPGNGGMYDFDCRPELAIGKEGYVGRFADFAETEGIDLTVVGPEQPLVDGMVDTFSERRLPIFGPTRAAAQLEASKAFAKREMEKHRVPTANYGVFDDIYSAREYIAAHWCGDRKLVVKASGLAAGKGAIVCETVDEAYCAVERMMGEKGEFGDAGRTVVIEERLRGPASIRRPEVSVTGISDGNLTYLLPESQDYKQVGNGDEGPNTGGMGAFSPVPFVTDEYRGIIRGKIVDPIIAAMREMGSPFRGALYPGLIITDDGPNVLEFNARFGDPEPQPTLMRVRSDIFPCLMASATGNLKGMPPFDVDPRAAVCVVLASGGYPGAYEKGREITGLDEVRREFGDRYGSDVMVFHAGTARRDGKIVTTGGRVLGVTALGDTLDEAAGLAYAAADMIQFKGKYCRRDIGRI